MGCKFMHIRRIKDKLVHYKPFEGYFVCVSMALSLAIFSICLGKLIYHLITFLMERTQLEYKNRNKLFSEYNKSTSEVEDYTYKRVLISEIEHFIEETVLIVLIDLFILALHVLIMQIKIKAVKKHAELDEEKNYPL